MSNKITEEKKNTEKKFADQFRRHCAKKMRDTKKVTTNTKATRKAINVWDGRDENRQ